MGGPKRRFLPLLESWRSRQRGRKPLCRVSQAPVLRRLSNQPSCKDMPSMSTRAHAHTSCSFLPAICLHTHVCGHVCGHACENMCGHTMHVQKHPNLHQFLPNHLFLMTAKAGSQTSIIALHPRVHMYVYRHACRLVCRHVYGHGRIISSLETRADMCIHIYIEVCPQAHYRRCESTCV